MENRAKEAPDFLFSETNGALLNTNNQALLNYKKAREQSRKMNSVASRLDKLESTVESMNQTLLFIAAALSEKNK